MSFDTTIPASADLTASVEATPAAEPAVASPELRVLKLKVKTSLRAGLGDVRSQWPHN